ncbi:MAG: GNAT family N-acetyltransferase [Rickettsiales bacterium]
MRSTLEFIGTVGLEPHMLPFAVVPTAAIGWKLLKKYWGYGYAYEAASAVLDHAFGTLKLSEVISLVPKGNDRSVRLMKRLGLSFDDESTPLPVSALTGRSLPPEKA